MNFKYGMGLIICSNYQAAMAWVLKKILDMVLTILILSTVHIQLMIDNGNGRDDQAQIYLIVC